MDNKARNKSKQDWNTAHYTQIKVSVDPVIASNFKAACIDSGISMAMVLSDFMCAFSGAPKLKDVSLSKNDSLSSRRLRRIRTKHLIHDLVLVKAAEQSYRDNIPPNLQNSQRFDNADLAVTSLDDAIDLLLDAFD
jgi:hypothetical protein